MYNLDVNHGDHLTLLSNIVGLMKTFKYKMGAYAPYDGDNYQKFHEHIQEIFSKDSSSDVRIKSTEFKIVEHVED